MQGSTAHAYSGTASGIYSGIGLISVPITVASGCSVTTVGGKLTSTITVASGGTADVRTTNIGASTNLAGPGTINRTSFRFTTSATSMGANAITFAIPLPDANYSLSFSLVSGAGNAAMTWSSKTGSGFTLNDSVGTNVWEVTVTHD